jgi:hypothetical protein
MKHWPRAGSFFATLVLLCGAALAQAQDVVINEIYYDDPSTDDEEFLELKGPGDLSLDGYVLIGINQLGTEYRTIDLTGQTIPTDGYFVVGMTGVLNADLIDDGTWQNGPGDGVELRLNGSTVDGVCYGTGGSICEGDPAEDPTEASLARCPDGQDTDDNAADFAVDPTPTPGTMNDADCAPVPTPRTICEVAEDDPATGRPALEGDLVEVTGVCISPSNTFSTFNQDIKITDGECCVTVFQSGTIDPVVAIGDEVTVVGTVSFYNGLTEISTPSLTITINSSGNPTPDPILLTTGDFNVNGENYESCLIGFTCVTFVGGTWPAEGSNSAVFVDDGSGEAQMFIDRDTDIDGSPEPTAPFSAIGVGGQYDSTEPYTEGYQLTPRSLADITFDDPACAAPEGACCTDPDGDGYEDICTVTTAADCAGTYQGDGSVCDPNPCPQPPPEGACCYPDGTCIVTIEADCSQQWLGPGTTCDPNPCPVATLETSWGKIKSKFHK